MRKLPRKVLHITFDHCFACSYCREQHTVTWGTGFFCEHPQHPEHNQVYDCYPIPGWCPLPDVPEGDVCGNCTAYRDGMCFKAENHPEETYSDSLACDDFESVGSL